MACENLQPVQGPWAKFSAKQGSEPWTKFRTLNMFRASNRFKGLEYDLGPQTVVLNRLSDVEQHSRASDGCVQDQGVIYLWTSHLVKLSLPNIHTIWTKLLWKWNLSRRLFHFQWQFMTCTLSSSNVILPFGETCWGRTISPFHCNLLLKIFL